MNDRNWNQGDPWEQSYYETGSTRPPKKRGGCLVVLIALVVILGGILTLLSLTNIRLLQKKVKDPDADSPIGFFSETPTEATAQPDTQPTQSTRPIQDGISLETSPQAVENVPQAGGMSLQDIYEKNIPSVVSISCDTGTGTGVVLSEDGYLVTNCHVVRGCATVEVLFTDGRILPATLVGTDEISDLAVLQVQAKDLTPAQFGDSDAVRVGDSVVAIGDPLGMSLRGTMTDGIISAINRNITTEGRTMNLLQTNAALNNGNSGGPLINCYGQVIGINTMKIGDMMNVNGVEGLGFAIPSTTVKEIVDQLIHQGYVSGRPTLGITGQTLTPLDILYYRLPQGIYITAVEPASDAAQKGIQPGDILVQFDDIRITDSDTLKNAINAKAAGDTVTVVIYRDGSQHSFSLTLDEARQ